MILWFSIGFICGGLCAAVAIILFARKMSMLGKEINIMEEG